MPPPKKQTHNHGLGKAIMNHRAKSRVVDRERELHTTEVYDNKPISVTQENDLENFLNTAALAGTDFTAERQNITILPGTGPGSSSTAADPYLLTPAEQAKLEAVHREHQSLLQVPRRPIWSRDTTPAQLERAERDAFLAWRKGLAELTDQQSLLLTPFERNLEVWRQLWRVLERSKLIVQIVDARNPLRFRCQDLEKYVEELSKLEDNPFAAPRKNLLLINKSDLLSEYQREVWADYLEGQNVEYAFFSAADAAALQEEEADETAQADQSSDGSSSGEHGDHEESDDEEEKEEDNEAIVGPPQLSSTSTQVDSNLAIPQSAPNPSASKSSRKDRTKILTVEELEDLFILHAQDDPTPTKPDAAHDSSTLSDPTDTETVKKLVVGLVGYPNVGKSSTINALVGAKKVSVSATPGKTKHFQTIHLSPRVILCDCPGLVFPQFASTKAELVCDGVLPIDQMREHTGPVGLLVRRIPRAILEATYGLQFNPDEDVTATALLCAYAVARGLSTGGGGQGRPDESRAARPILKDYVNARLLYCEPPPVPGIKPDEFNAAGLRSNIVPRKLAPINRVPVNADTYIRPTGSRRADALDQSFFQSVALHGVAPVPSAHFLVKGRAAQLDCPTRLRLVPGEVQVLGPNGLPVTGKNSKKHFKGKSKRTKMRSGKGYDEF
ncbi:uncharacterized protein MELLADRAFT_77243 [Melampsora larici-populina 98AG31]|uniref:CP-type G domain-containing protein n=1 Tax=Melampsora larici-populina (strain 98AG31 / pathotype 3-4-7) TaxID=747676 RepID=F4RFA2_MELLP|nr:uncharacterized protein MELLADRAFT_77243 [Melampsora larici-populina 98AG31]EGG08778.1 hypothetical protein MELLADRAFT_77243 [Melampsora larici-populina 98AG31]